LAVDDGLLMILSQLHDRVVTKQLLRVIIMQ